MIPILGALMGGGASGIFGGAGGGGLMGGLLGSLFSGSGGLGGVLSNLFGGGQRSGGNEQTNALLGDIKDMLGQLLDDKGGCCGSEGGRGHGGPEGGRGPGGPEGGRGHGGTDGCDKPGRSDHGCRPEPEDCSHDCEPPEEPKCGCDEADESDDAGWDGKDKSPSLDRERGAARLLEQAKETDDPKEKRELIEMALEMLGDGPKGDGLFGKLKEKMDGNSYDKDIVKQAEKMLDEIDDGCLSECGESTALDSVIDMLMEEGGVDGKPAANDANGDGRYTKLDKWIEAGIIEA